MPRDTNDTRGTTGTAARGTGRALTDRSTCECETGATLLWSLHGLDSDMARVVAEAQSVPEARAANLARIAQHNSRAERA